MPGSKPHDKPSLTVDVVVVAPMDGQHKVLLIQRKHPPFEGRWALPGGFVEPHEPLEDAAAASYGRRRMSSSPAWSSCTPLVLRVRGGAA